MLPSQTRDGHTAFQLAAENNVETLKRMWDWAEETLLNPNELKNKLLLSTDVAGYMAWHHAVAKGSLESLETLLFWVKKAELNTGEFLLAESGEGFTTFQLAARNNHVETQNLMLVWAEGTQLNTIELTENLI